jgi:glyoxylase-like metal-dependent hydrolase (beta-lactamase superfamily II)
MIMKEIDFSSKHDILIRSEDGSLRPMDEPYFESKLVAPGTWQILSDGDFIYLIEGDDDTLVIDSGYGCGNIREYCQSLTSKPVRNVVNTHDHFDHTANNGYFDRAYMSAETKKLATTPMPSFEGIDFPRDYPIEVIGEGYKFHLGNRDLEVLEVPDHATGSLVFLDSRERILFSGDEISQTGKRINTTVENVERQLQKLMARRSEFDRLCAGPGVFEASWIEKYLENVHYILAGHEGSPILQWPPHNEMPVPPSPPGVTVYDRRYPRPPDRKPNDPTYLREMNYNDCRVIYDLRHIRD